MSHLSDAMLPTATLNALPLNRARLTAFVPITIALFGVAVVLFGGVSARAPESLTASASAVDPIVTGSIMASADRFKALQKLDD